MEESIEKQLIRLGDVDLLGNKRAYVALRKIKGISYTLANAICSIANISRNKKIGNLTDEEVKTINSILKEPTKYNIKSFMLNRQRDVETGNDRHIISSELRLTTEFDIKRMKMIKCYKGMRHAFGQPVRGQRTKAHFRKSSSTGIKKKPGIKKGKV